MKRITVMVLMLLSAASVSLAAGYNYLAPEQLRQWIETGRDMTILDIQPTDEFKAHHFKNAVETNAYPAKSTEEKMKLDAALAQLSKSGKDVVVICPRGGSGARNTHDYIKEKGVDEKRIFILKQGMQGWPYKELTLAGGAP